MMIFFDSMIGTPSGRKICGGRRKKEYQHFFSLIILQLSCFSSWKMENGANRQQVNAVGFVSIALRASRR